VLVNEGHGHERTEFGHSLEMHSLFTNDFWDMDVLESIDYVFLFFFLFAFFFSLSIFSSIFISVLVEDIVSDTLIRLKNGIYNKAMVFSSVGEFDYFRSFNVQVLIIAGILSDFNFGVLQISNVNTSSAGVLLEEIG
jgi:hypothetical protein